MTQPLIPEQNRLIKEDLSDQYLAIAYAIEQSLLSTGAIPNQDYTRLDLYHLAQPFVLEVMKHGHQGLKLNFPQPAKEKFSQNQI